jgi:integrase
VGDSRIVAHRFGGNLRRLRKRADLSQEEMGFRSGLHRTEIGILERGERLPRIDTMLKLGAALGVKFECPLLAGLEWKPGVLERGSFSSSADSEQEVREEVTNRSGHPYKPSTLRGYRRDLDEHVLPELGNRKLNALTTAELQEQVDRWHGDGKPASTIRNRIKPLQAIYRRARARGGLATNPTRDLELPVPRPDEVEIVAAADAAELLESLPIEDKPIWATALYAGLRYGELRALRWRAVDFAAGTIRVEESWDPKAGPIEPKTRTSRRATPMPDTLRELLQNHQELRGNPAGDELVFGLESGGPFNSAALYHRADAAWREAGLDGRLRLHQARHSYASYLIAAGANPKAISTFMGHSSINLTYDLYGHLMPGTEVEVASLLGSYLDHEIQ